MIKLDQNYVPDKYPGQKPYEIPNLDHPAYCDRIENRNPHEYSDLIEPLRLNLENIKDKIFDPITKLPVGLEYTTPKSGIGLPAMQDVVLEFDGLTFTLRQKVQSLLYNPSGISSEEKLPKLNKPRELGSEIPPHQ